MILQSEIYLTLSQELVFTSFVPSLLNLNVRNVKSFALKLISKVNAQKTALPQAYLIYTLGK